MIEFDRLPRATILRIREQSRDKGLDEIGTAWAIEAEAERAIVAQLCALLPGSYCMDPPDGGSVTVLEQLRRMAEDARKWREHQEHIRLAYECERKLEG